MSHTHFDSFANAKGIAVTNTNGVISVTPTTLNWTQLSELLKAGQLTKHVPSLVGGVLTFTPGNG